MPKKCHLKVPRDHPVSISRPSDATELAAAFARRDTEALLLLALLDDDHNLLELLPLAGTESELPRFFEELAAKPSAVSSVVLITKRPPVFPADRPDDELLWQELVAIAAAGSITLLDWIVIAGDRWAWSVAEFAPTQAAW